MPSPTVEQETYNAQFAAFHTPEASPNASPDPDATIKDFRKGDYMKLLNSALIMYSKSFVRKSANNRVSAGVGQGHCKNVEIEIIALLFIYNGAQYNQTMPVCHHLSAKDALLHSIVSVFPSVCTDTHHLTYQAHCVMFVSYLYYVVLYTELHLIENA